MDPKQLDNLLQQAYVEQGKSDNTTTTTVQNTSDEQFATQLLNSIKGNNGIIPQFSKPIPGYVDPNTLPQPSIPERFMANALFTGNENARKSYLMQRGKNPNEPGMFTSPRETLADVVESAGPAAKLAGQIGGEALGTPFGVAGIAGGGGLGRSAVQTGVEGLADVTGMGIPGGNERVAKEGAIGAITSLGGQVLAKGVPKVISMINDKFPLVKKSEEFMLTNITRMSKGMQDWVKGRWTDVYNTAQDPLRELTLKVNSGIIDPIRRIRTDFGKQLTAAKLDAFMNAVRPDFTGLASTIKEDILPSYFGNITSKEGKSILLLAKKLEKSNVGSTTAQKGYVKAMDSLTELQRKITAGYSKLSPDDMRSTNAITSIFKTFKQMVTDRAKATSPDLAQKIDDYSKFASLIDEWDTYVGHDKKQILGFLYDHVFADTSVENVYGREAINAMFTPEYLGGANLSHVKDLVTAIWMRGGEVATSGYKAGIPRLMAEQAGKVLGATAVGGGMGAAVGGQKGAKIGATLGFLGTLPYTNPQWTSSAYKFVEGLQNPILKQFPSSTLPNMIGKGVEFSPKLLTKPLGEAIGELSNQFGINTSQEDVNKLKASKLK